MEENLYKLGHLKLQENAKSQYYMVKRDTISVRLEGHCDSNIGQLEPGMLVQGIEVENSDKLKIRVCTKTTNDIWYKTEWKAPQADFICISSTIWHHLCSVSSLEERMRLVSNKQFCKDVENIKIPGKVWFCPDCNNPETIYSASVEYIGPVPELGDGYYFGLDTQDPSCIYQSYQFIHKYFTPHNSIGTFTTISSINPRKAKAYDQIKNFEKNFLCNDITKYKKTDNFFVNKKKEINNSRDDINNLNINKYSSLIDTDNNNQLIRPEKQCISISTDMPIKNKTYDQQNDNKLLYKNVKYFDPLNSDYEGDKETKSVQQTPNTNLNIGSCVKVLVDNETHYGVVRWIGSPENTNTNKLMAAIELDDFHPSATDGTYQNIRYFECSPKKAWFTDVKDCHQYDMAASVGYYKPELQDFECIQSSVINGAVPPISVVNGDLDKICGKNRGIQGHHNSCYLDTTLFSMFAFTSIFDHLLFRPPNEKDCPEYEEVQRVLREEIVNPLRKELFVGADRVMKLRTLLEKSSSISGLTCEEKDPEEFLTSLIAQTLKAEPFLLLSSGQDAYHYQLFVEKDEKIVFPTVQQLLEQSFLTSDIKLKEVPSCFILQMPRFGKSFKMYPKIQPTLLLDVTDIIEDSPRQCTVCGRLAKFECKECYGQRGEGLESTAFCKDCLDKAHNHEKRSNHKPKALVLPMEYEMLKGHCTVRRLYLELLAVVCIETSHYVSFVKCAPGADAPWCFFDSMADRKGEQNGYNIPEMVACPDFPYWLSKEGADHLSTVTDDRTLPEHAKRLLCDGYMCMYQSPSAIMYKYSQ